MILQLLKNRHNSIRAFTLIEVLLSLALVAALMGMFFSSTIVSTRTSLLHDKVQEIRHSLYQVQLSSIHNTASAVLIGDKFLTLLLGDTVRYVPISPLKIEVLNASGKVITAPAQNSTFTLKNSSNTILIGFAVGTGFVAPLDDPFLVNYSSQNLSLYTDSTEVTFNIYGDDRLLSTFSFSPTGILN